MYTRQSPLPDVATALNVDSYSGDITHMTLIYDSYIGDMTHISSPQPDLATAYHFVVFSGVASFACN
jgi:hypothetical protein